MIASFGDHAANERTFLAWVRTAIAIVAFGLATARLAPGPVEVWSERALLLSGAAIVVLAYLRMRALHRRIASPDREREEGTGADALLLGLVLALFVTLGVFGLHVA